MMQLLGHHRHGLLDESLERREQLRAERTIDHAMIAGERDRDHAGESDAAVRILHRLPPRGPDRKMVAWGGLMIAENSRTPYMPRLDIAEEPP